MHDNKVQGNFHLIKIFHNYHIGTFENRIENDLKPINYSYFLNIIRNKFNSILGHVIQLLKTVDLISELRSIEIYLLLFFTAYYNKKTRCLSSNQYADIYVLLISFMN